MAEVKSCGFLIYRNHYSAQNSNAGPESDPSPMFLLMRHSDRWDLPKGHVDSGENDMQCALRELEEETGIREADIEIDEHFRFVTEYPVFKKKKRRTVTKQLVIFLARLTGDVEIIVTEHPGFEWFEWNPPHEIQPNTIDGLLGELEIYWQ